MNEGREFEEAVRRIARALWGDPEGGAENIGNREFDGVFRTSDTIYVLECTIQRSTSKLKNDLGKLKNAITELRSSKRDYEIVRGFLIVKNELTADQRDIIKPFKKYNICVESYDSFRSRIFDGNEYLMCRYNHRFGSTYDFENNRSIININKFIPMNFINKKTKEVVNWEKFEDYIDKNDRNIYLIGSYGSGKSFSLYKVFDSLACKYKKGKSYLCPVYINLYEHIGQRNPQEALMRHCELIGFKNYMDLIKAWKAGFCRIILDGFDELSVLRWTGSRDRLKEFRRKSMDLIKNFIKDSPVRTYVIVSGRDNYFDSDSEFKDALNITNDCLVLQTTDFEDTQIEMYMKKNGIDIEYPDWLPAKPLFVDYAVRKNIIPKMDKNMSIYTGWDSILDMISDREASQHDSIDKEYIRLIIERLATYARKTTDSLGLFSIDDIKNVFREITNQYPDENSMPLLMRFPGLGQSSTGEGRTFVDDTLARAAMSFEIIKYIKAPHQYKYPLKSEEIADSISELTINIISDFMINYKSESSINVLDVASRKHNNSFLAMDIFTIFINSGIHIKNPNNVKIYIDEGISNFLNFSCKEQEWAKSVILQDGCILNFVKISKGFNLSFLPVLESGVYIYELQGVRPQQWDKVNIEKYSDEAIVSSKILKYGDMPQSIRVLITILKKLFLQKGSARQESAFYRGALTQSQKAIIPDILRILKKHNFIYNDVTADRRLWKPNRSYSNIVNKIIANPLDEVHPMLKEIKDL